MRLQLALTVQLEDMIAILVFTIDRCLTMISHSAVLVLQLLHLGSCTVSTPSRLLYFFDLDNHYYYY